MRRLDPRGVRGPPTLGPAWFRDRTFLPIPTSTRPQAERGPSHSASHWTAPTEAPAVGGPGGQTGRAGRGQARQEMPALDAEGAAGRLPQPGSEPFVYSERRSFLEDLSGGAMPTTEDESEG